jgi:TonB family protein
MKSMMVLATLLAGAPASAAVAVPEAEPGALVPLGKWQVEYAKSSCIISRAFGEGEQRILFTLRPAPSSETVRFWIIKPGPGGRGARGNADVSLSGGFIPKFAEYASVTSNGMRVTSIDLPRETLESLAKGDLIAIKASRWVNVSLRLPGFDKVMTEIKKCEADLLTSWGLDAAAQTAIATPPKGRLAPVFVSDDYPEEALDNAISGTVGVRLKVEPDGTVSDCTVLESSGAPVLDRQTCLVAKRRGHYTPAMSREGRPLWSFTFERITWQIVDM